MIRRGETMEALHNLFKEKAHLDDKINDLRKFLNLGFSTSKPIPEDEVLADLLAQARKMLEYSMILESRMVKLLKELNRESKTGKDANQYL